MTLKSYKIYKSPSIDVINIIIHEELLNGTLVVDPGEEGDQEDAEVHVRDMEGLQEERDVWNEGGLW